MVRGYYCPPQNEVYEKDHRRLQHNPRQGLRADVLPGRTYRPKSGQATKQSLRDVIGWVPCFYKPWDCFALLSTRRCQEQTTKFPVFLSCRGGEGFNLATKNGSYSAVGRGSSKVPLPGLPLPFIRPVKSQTRCRSTYICPSTP